MAFLQNAIFTLRKSIDDMRRSTDPTDFAETLRETRKFYERLSLQPSRQQGLDKYPTLKTSPKGMKLSFRQALVFRNRVFFFFVCS